MQEKNYDLENRFVDFAARIVDIVEALPKTRAGNYIEGQLIRSGCQLYSMEKLRRQNQEMILFTK